MTWARRAVRALQPWVPRSPEGVHVLAYHLVEAGSDLPVDVSAAVFRAQIEALRSVAELVSLEVAAQRLAGGETDSLQCVLTFDDAFENFYEKAWPILCEQEVPVTLFVPVGFLAGESDGPFAPRWRARPLDWVRLREMAESGRLEVGSHSWSHADLRALSGEALARELRDSRDLLEQRTGRSVGSFCYPRALWDRRVEAEVRSAYDRAVIGGGRQVVPRNFDPLRLWRTSIRRDAGPGLPPGVGARFCLEERLADLVRRRRGLSRAR